MSAPDVVLALGRFPRQRAGRWAMLRRPVGADRDRRARVRRPGRGLRARAPTLADMPTRSPPCCARSSSRRPSSRPSPSCSRSPRSNGSRNGCRGVSRLDDERIDAIYAWMLFLPLFVVLIYYGYLEHGLPGATGWSVATLAPHYLLKLLNDRRNRLARNATALEQLNVALRRKQQELAGLRLHRDPRPEEPGERHPAHRRRGARSRARRSSRSRPEATSSRSPAWRRPRSTSSAICSGLFRITTTDEPVADVSLKTVVASVDRRLQAQIAAKRRASRWASCRSSAGQAKKLEHAIANLLSNAVKYVPRGARGSCR